MNDEVHFTDIIEPRNTSCGIFKFMTRAWNPLKTQKLEKDYTPQDLKNVVEKSIYLESVIHAESIRSGKSKEMLREEVIEFLEEIGLEKKMHTIRWMGVVFLKVSFMMKVRVFVNEPPVLKLKETMGNNPVLFLPTHRSYADFCLMTYLCYHYDIDFPAVAAGMDFYSMAVVGKKMRETGAFYIRRTLIGSPLYAATLRQYVRTLVAKYSSPMEFFLEGTRSRSNKSLSPKYGMLSMTLVPLFAREVPDITIVPVNISYDRLMEQSLFAYEHLGVPKPKESTGGLLKSLHMLNDYFGNIYINMGTPFSVKDYLNDDISDKQERLKPLDLQHLTPEQFAKVQNVAKHVITLQQKNTVATISNLVALIMMDSLIRNRVLTFEEVLAEVEWMMKVLRSLGSSVFENDVRRSVERILVVHGKMLKLDKEKKLRLLSSSPMDISSDVKSKMKGYILKAETMVNALPIIQLQLYVNPILHYLVPSAVICLIVLRNPTDREQLAKDYHLLRKLLKYEFFHVDEQEETTFNKALQYCIDKDVSALDGTTYSRGCDDKLQHLLQWSVWPALTTLLACADVLIELRQCEHKQALARVQERVEASKCHPYCLSLEASSNCLQGLVLYGALSKRCKLEVSYEVLPDVMDECRSLIRSVLPTFNVPFDRSNAVILDQRVVLSRL